MEFGHLLECNMRNIFLKKSYTKRSGETITSLVIPIRVTKVSFHFFDKLKYEIRNKVLIFVSTLKLRQ